MNITSRKPLQSNGRQQTILIVDDNPTNLRVIFDNLQRSGYKTLLATDGETALKRARYTEPDLILLDVMMPGIDGFETCRRLKEDETTRDIPVIFMTALENTEDKIKGFEAGAVDYITKPFQYQETLARVATHLRIRDLTRSLKKQTARLEHRTTQLRVAAEVARDTTAACRLEVLFNQAVNLIRDRFEFYQAAIFLIDEQGEYVTLKAATGKAGQDLQEQGFRLKVGENSIVGHVASNCQPYLATDVSCDPLHLEHSLSPETSSEIALPLQVGDRIIGVLDVQSREPLFDEEEELALQTLADQLAVAVEKLRLFEQTQAMLEQRLHAVVSSAPVVLFALDREGLFTLAEGNGLEILELEPQDLLGQSLPDVFRSPEIADHFRLCMAGEAFVATLEIDEAVFEAHWSPLKDSEENVSGATIVATDITERVQAERQREALIAELETKNAELERFVYTVSHDLKSPLITIRGFLGFVEQAALAGDTEQMKGDLARIENATDKMRQLLDSLLELSRIGRLMNPPEEVPFGELAREALSTVAGRLQEQDVEVKVEIAPHLPVVCGDRPRLREVIENLLDNAIKYMGDQPEPCVEIGMRRDDGERVFFVRDNGVGIEPHYHERVFGLFEKLNPEVEGAGVGLAIVRRIVEVHGGRIWVESEGIGEGSTFCFTLSNTIEPTSC